MTIKIFTKAILSLIFIICFSVISHAQIQPITPDEDDDDIFDTDIEGSTPRSDDGCYFLKNEDESPLRFSISIFAGLDFNAHFLPCDIQALVHIGNESHTMNFSFSKATVVNDEDQIPIKKRIESEDDDSFLITQNHIDNFFTPCIDGVQYLEIVVELICTDENGVTRVLTLGEVNGIFDRNYQGVAAGGFDEAYTSKILLPFCCFEDDEIIDNGLIENRSVLSASNIKVMNQATHFELILDNTFVDKDVTVSLLDLSGRRLSVSSYKLEKNQKSILVDKPVNQLNMYLLSIRTDDQIISMKVVNY